MRILIVDDEAPARARLRRMLAPEDGIEALAEAQDGVEALACIAGFLPDVLFLDIAMPELSGIELAAALPDPAPLIVFVTAHDRYALQAFDADAVDYLTKPFDAARLRRTLQRVQARHQARLREHRSAPAAARPLQPLQQLLVPERGGTRVVRTSDIQWIETADNYVVLHTGAASPLLRRTLAALLPQLGPAFMRCHRRAAVHLPSIERVLVLDKGDCELLLRGGARVPCSRQYREAVLERL